MDAIPLPKFRQPLGLDDPLPTVPATTPAGDQEPTSPPDPHRPNPPEDDRPEPPPPSLEPPAARRTRTYSDGDIKEAAKFVRGLLAITAASVAALLARNGRRLRQPTPGQLADIADPLGAILARHLPAEALAPDLIDATSAAAAAHAYVLDGPLAERIPTAAGITYPEEIQL